MVEVLYYGCLFWSSVVPWVVVVGMMVGLLWCYRMVRVMLVSS